MCICSRCVRVHVYHTIHQTSHLDVGGERGPTRGCVPASTVSTKHEKKFKKVICKLCEGVNPAYGGGTSNLLNHLEAKHPVAYKKAVPGETCAPQSQALLAHSRRPALLHGRTTIRSIFVH